MKKVVLGGVCSGAVLMATGCTVFTVATTAVSAAGTAISVGVTAGSVAVGATTAVAKGAVNAGNALLGQDEDD